ncbi:MAG: hypothetical protein A2Z75_06100 [Chloroflexi bacterium RBG_13_50_10]|nr:MAG: hypothetical protein A2Z75_06100 [Chloroflexi bacterium RBG_13_50_10]
MDQINLERCKLIACAAVIEEMLPFMPPGTSHEVLDFGLHTNPKSLRRALQNAINSSAPDIETILLGYGLCSQAVIGLRSGRRTLIIPRVDDCIAIFLGSAAEYQKQYSSVPGTYYLTRGWIEFGDTPFSEYDILVERYGEQIARRIINKILKNYTRLAFINTGNNKLEHYRDRARSLAEQFGLRYEEIEGSDVLIQKMMYRPWDDEFIIIPPGKTISFFDFRKNGP